VHFSFFIIFINRELRKTEYYLLEQRQYIGKMTASTDDSNGAANGGGGPEEEEAVPQAQGLPEDELLVRDEDASSDNLNDDDDVEEEKKFMKCVRRIGGFYHRAIDAWPRTSALTFGVVLPLFFLIAMSALFGE
jgi:hypothetical protein